MHKNYLKYNFCIIAAMFIFWGLLDETFADLRPSSWDDLVEQSQIIILATPQKLSITDKFNTGNAELIITKIIKGSPPSNEIKINWSSEVHSQMINDISCEWLMFLRYFKFEENIYSPTYYGESYMKIDEVYIENKLRRVIFYDSYFNNIEMVPRNLIKFDNEIKIYVGGKLISLKANFIFLDDLLKYFESLK